MEVKQEFMTIEDFKKKTAEILNGDYQKFFDDCETLISEIELKVENPILERMLTRSETIQSEIKQIFYKEKLILFPFLEKSFAEDGLIEFPISVSQIKEQTAQLGKKIRQFESDFRKIETGLTDEQIDQIYKKLDELCSLWDHIVKQKEELFGSFLLRKTKG
ncbi:MAG: hypothetical protein WBA59_04410 [Moheibacter sp.]